MNNRVFRSAPAVLWALVVAFTGLAHAQGMSGMSNASRMDIEHADEAVLTRDGGQTLKGGVRVVFYSDKPDEPPLRIATEFAHIPATPEGGSPPAIELKGKVEVTSGEGTIKSDQAELDVGKDSVEFTGHVTGTHPRFRQFSSDKLTYNLKTGDITMSNLTAREISVRDAGAAPKGEADPSLLSPADITDWPVLLRRLKEGGAAATPSPAKRMMSLLKPNERQGFAGLATDAAPNAQSQSLIVRVLNGLLRQRDLYDEASWKGVDLPADARDLLGRKRAELSATQVTRLNRLLVQAAFPGAIAPAKGA